MYCILSDMHLALAAQCMVNCLVRLRLSRQNSEVPFFFPASRIYRSLAHVLLPCTSRTNCPRQGNVERAASTSLHVRPDLSANPAYPGQLPPSIPSLTCIQYQVREVLCRRLACSLETGTIRCIKNRRACVYVCMYVYIDGWSADPRRGESVLPMKNEASLLLWRPSYAGGNYMLPSRFGTR